MFNFSKRPAESEVKIQENTDNTLRFIVKSIAKLSKKINFDDESKINNIMLRQMQALMHLQKSEEKKLSTLNEISNIIQKKFNNLEEFITKSKKFSLTNYTDGIPTSHQFLDKFTYKEKEYYIWQTTKNDNNDDNDLTKHDIEIFVENLVKTQKEFSEKIQKNFPGYPNNINVQYVPRTINKEKKYYVWQTTKNDNNDDNDLIKHDIKNYIKIGIENLLKIQKKFIKKIQRDFPGYPNNTKIKDVQQTINEEKQSFQETLEEVKNQIKEILNTSLLPFNESQNPQTKKTRLEKFLQSRCDALVCYLCRQDKQFAKEISNQITVAVCFHLKNNEQKSLRDNIMYIIRTAWDFNYQHTIQPPKTTYISKESCKISYDFQIMQSNRSKLLLQTLLKNIKRCTSLSANDYIEILNYFKDKNLEEENEKQLYMQIINQAVKKANQIPSNSKIKTITNKQIAKRHIKKTNEKNNIYLFDDENSLTHVEFIKEIKDYHYKRIADANKKLEKYKNKTTPSNLTQEVKILNSGVLYVVPRKLGWLFVDFRDLKCPAISTLIVLQRKGFFQKLTHSLQKKKYTFLEQKSEESYKTINLPEEKLNKKLHKVEESNIKSYIKIKNLGDVDKKTMLIIGHYINRYLHPITKNLIHNRNLKDTALARIYILHIYKYKCGKHYLDVNSKNIYDYTKKGMCIKQSNKFFTNKPRNNVNNKFETKTLYADTDKKTKIAPPKNFIKWEHQSVPEVTVGNNLKDISVNYSQDPIKQKILQQCLNEKNLIKQILDIYTKDYDIVIWQTNAGEGMVICNISENKQYLLGEHGFAQIPSGVVLINSSDFKIDKNIPQLNFFEKSLNITNEKLKQDFAYMLDKNLIKLNSGKLTLLIREFMKYNEDIIEFKGKDFDDYIAIVEKIAKIIPKFDLQNRNKVFEFISKTKIQDKDNKKVDKLYKQIAAKHVAQLVVEKNYREILRLLIQKKSVIQYKVYSSETPQEHMVIDNKLILQIVTREKSNWYRYNYPKKFQKVINQTSLIENLSKNIDKELSQKYESQEKRIKSGWNFKEDKIFTLISESKKYQKDRKKFELCVVKLILDKMLNHKITNNTTAATNILYVFKERTKYQDIFKMYTQINVSSSNSEAVDKMIKLIANLEYNWNLEEIKLLTNSILQKTFDEKTAPPTKYIIKICIKYAEILLENKKHDDFVQLINDIANSKIDLIGKFIDELLKTLPKVSNVTTTCKTNKKVNKKIDDLIDAIDDSENPLPKLQSLVNILGSDKQQATYKANRAIEKLIIETKNELFAANYSYNNETTYDEIKFSKASTKHTQKIQLHINSLFPKPENLLNIEFLINFNLGTKEQKKTFSLYQKFNNAIITLQDGKWIEFLNELKVISFKEIPEKYKQKLKTVFMQGIKSLTKISSAIDVEKCNNIKKICGAIGINLEEAAEKLLNLLRDYTSTTKLQDKNSVNIIVNCYRILQQLELNNTDIKNEANVRIKLLLPYYLWYEHTENVKINIKTILTYLEISEKLKLNQDSFCRVGMLVYLYNFKSNKKINDYIARLYSNKSLPMGSTDFIGSNKNSKNRKRKKSIHKKRRSSVIKNNKKPKLVIRKNLQKKSEQSPETRIKDEANTLRLLYNFYKESKYANLDKSHVRLLINFTNIIKNNKNKQISDLSYQLAKLDSQIIQKLFQDKAESLADLVINAATNNSCIKMPLYAFCKQIRLLLHKAKNNKLVSYDKAILKLTMLCEQSSFSTSKNVRDKGQHQPTNFYHAVVEDVFAIIKAELLQIVQGKPCNNKDNDIKRNAMMILCSVNLDMHLQEKFKDLDKLFFNAINALEQLSKMLNPMGNKFKDHRNLLPSYTCCKLFLTMLDVANSQNLKITEDVKSSYANLFHQLNEVIYKFAEIYSLALKKQQNTENKHDISILKKFYEEAVQDGTVFFTNEYKSLRNIQLDWQSVKKHFREINNSLVLTCKWGKKEKDNKSGYIPDRLFFTKKKEKGTSLEISEENQYGKKLFDLISKKSWENSLLQQYSILYLLYKQFNFKNTILYYKFFPSCLLNEIKPSNQLCSKYKTLQKSVTKLTK